MAAKPETLDHGSTVNKPRSRRSSNLTKAISSQQINYGDVNMSAEEMGSREALSSNVLNIDENQQLITIPPTLTRAMSPVTKRRKTKVHAISPIREDKTEEKDNVISKLDFDHPRETMKKNDNEQKSQLPLLLDSPQPPSVPITTPKPSTSAKKIIKLQPELKSKGLAIIFCIVNYIFAFLSFSGCVYFLTNFALGKDSII